jgi:hypothetical protein
MSGGIVSFVCQPLDLLRNNLASENDQKKAKILSKMKYIWKQHGIQRGFFRGVVSSIWLNAAYRGTSIGFFDTLKTLNNEYSKAQMILLTSIFVGVSSIFFHPLDTVRRTYMSEINFNETTVNITRLILLNNRHIIFI